MSNILASLTFHGATPAGKAFVEGDSLAGHMLASVAERIQLSQAHGLESAPAVLSPIFQDFVPPAFYLALLDALRKIASSVDIPQKTQLRGLIWAQLFAIVGHQSHSGERLFAPVIEEAAQKMGQNLIDVEVLFISFLLTARVFPQYFSPDTGADQLPTGQLQGQLVERSAHDFFQYLKAAAQTRYSPQQDFNSTSFNNNNSNSLNLPNQSMGNAPQSASNVNSNSSFTFSSSPSSSTSSSASQAKNMPPNPSSPFSSFMFVTQSDTPMFQKFRRSEFQEMTFVAQPTSSLDKKGAPPKKEEAPKPINELMGSFRIGGGFPQVSAAPKTNEWKDESNLQTSMGSSGKPAYNSSLARSVKKPRKNTSNPDGSTSNSSSPRNPSPSFPRSSSGSPGIQVPAISNASDQFEFSVAPNSPGSPMQVGPTDYVPLTMNFNSGGGNNSSHDSPRSSTTHSPPDSPRRADGSFAMVGLPKAHLGHSPSATSSFTRGGGASPGLSQSDPGGVRLKKRKSAFIEVMPGSFSKPTTMQQPEILSLGIDSNSGGASSFGPQESTDSSSFARRSALTTSAPIGDPRVGNLQMFHGNVMPGRGRSMSARGLPPSGASSVRLQSNHMRSRSNEQVDLRRIEDKGEAMDVDIPG